MVKYSDKGVNQAKPSARYRIFKTVDVDRSGFVEKIFSTPPPPPPHHEIILSCMLFFSEILVAVTMECAGSAAGKLLG